jgi:hypothetical protein
MLPATVNWNDLPVMVSGQTFEESNESSEASVTGLPKPQSASTAILSGGSKEFWPSAKGSVALYSSLEFPTPEDLRNHAIAQSFRAGLSDSRDKSLSKPDSTRFPDPLPPGHLSHESGKNSKQHKTALKEDVEVSAHKLSRNDFLLNKASTHDSLRIDVTDREKEVLKAMSQLEVEHQAILQRKSAELTKIQEEEDARKATENQIASLETQIRAIDVLRSKHMNDQTRHAAENIIVAATKSNRERETLAHLLALAKARVANKSAYFRMWSLLFFFLIYASTVLVQKDISTAFEVESRLLSDSFYLWSARISDPRTAAACLCRASWTPSPCTAPVAHSMGVGPGRQGCYRTTTSSSSGSTRASSARSSSTQSAATAAATAPKSRRPSGDLAGESESMPSLERVCGCLKVGASKGGVLVGNSSFVRSLREVLHWFCRSPLLPQDRPLCAHACSAADCGRADTSEVVTIDVTVCCSQILPRERRVSWNAAL